MDTRLQATVNAIRVIQPYLYQQLLWRASFLRVCQARGVQGDKGSWQDLAILSSYFLLNRVTSLAGPFNSHRDWFPVQANSATVGVHWGFSFVSFSCPGLKSADRSIILIAHSTAEKEQWISRVGKQLVIGRSSVLIDDDYDWSHIEACKAASHDPNDPGDCTCILDLKLFQGT